jgi:hypothetical protein
MLESLFIISIVIGFIFLLKGIDDSRMAYSWISILSFVFAMAGAIYIQVPGATVSYMDIGATIICFALIIINLMHIVAMIVDNKMAKKYHL